MEKFDKREAPWDTYTVRMSVDHQSSIRTQTKEVEEYEQAADLIETQAREIERLRAERDTPHVSDFLEAVKLEAAHQRERWGSDHDAGKTPFDWFWLIGYLAQKAADAATRGDAFKALHHTISTAAALANWHSAMAQVDNTMRPGIVPDDEAQARAALGEKQ